MTTEAKYELVLSASGVPAELLMLKSTSKYWNGVTVSTEDKVEIQG
ncbi:hypothetical protein NFH70_004690 [Salmonella enterica]|nr:hypothetical protein [Salmonella enterica]EIA4659107.1 hypothetical protein [Salmonella enterica]EJI5637390.1 hypothetical protein [Salmonella enterica]EJP9626284.1 hypothetical protein [Salmonella enterica]